MKQLISNIFIYIIFFSGRNEFKTTPEKKETKEFSRLSTFRKTLPLHLEPVAITTDQTDKSSSRYVHFLTNFCHF